MKIRADTIYSITTLSCSENFKKKTNSLVDNFVELTQISQAMLFAHLLQHFTSSFVVR